MPTRQESPCAEVHRAVREPHGALSKMSKGAVLALSLVFAGAFAWGAEAARAESRSSEGFSGALAAARRAYLSGKYEQAEKELRELIGGAAGARKKTAAGALLVRLLIETGRTKEAKDIALRLHSEQPRKSRYAALAGEALFARFELREAEELFTRALAAEAEGSNYGRRARVFLKRIYDLTGRTEESEGIVDHFWDFNNARIVSRKTLDPADFMYVAEAVRDFDATATKVAFRHYRRAYKRDPDLHEAYLGAGELAVEVFDWARAEREFGALLKRNPNHPRAHLGLARMYLAASKNKEAEDEAKKALEANPNLAGARAVLASLHLIDDRLDDARREIDSALKACPSDPQTLAMDAAWKLARRGRRTSGDGDAFEAAVERTLGLYPGYPGVRLMAASVLERRRRFPEALEQYREATKLDPDGWEGHYGAGMTLVRMGEERAGYAALETAHKLNGFNVWAFNTLVAMDRDFKEGKLARRDTEHFVIKLTRTQDDVLGEHLENALERIWDEETRRFGFEPRGPDEFGRKVLFEMFADHEDFSARTTGIPNLGALGATLGQVVTMPSPSWGVGIGKPFRWTEVARHEFGHVITLQLTDYRIPRWFTEGVSVFIERDPMTSWDQLLAHAVNESEIVSLDRLNSLFTRPETPSDFALGYYLATLVVEFLVNEYGFEVIIEACGLYREGRSSEEVMTGISGLTAAEFDRSIESYVRDHVERTKAWAPPGRKEMERLRARLSKDPADAEARARVAEGLVASFRYDEARAEAERALSESGGKLARAHVVLGLVAKVRARDNAGAIRHFRDAVKADPDDFFANLYLGLALREAMRLEEAAAALERAHELTPRFSEPIPAWGALSLADASIKVLLNLGEVDRAGKVASRAAAAVPADWRSAKVAASLALEGGKVREAAALLERVLETNPFDAEGQLMFAGAQEKLARRSGQARGRGKSRRIALAARAYRAAKALAPREAKAYLGLARTLAELGRSEEARAVIDELRRFDPENEEAARIERGLRE